MAAPHRRRELSPSSGHTINQRSPLTNPHKQPTPAGGRVLRNAGLYTVAELALRLTSAFLVPLYTRVLTPGELGVWSLATMLVAALSLAYNPALHGSVTRYFFELESRPAELRRFLGTVSTFLLGWSVVLTTVLFLAGPWVFAVAFRALPFSPFGRLVVLISALSVLEVVPKAVWSSAERAGRFVSVSLAASLLNVTSSILFVALGFGVEGLLWARVASTALLGGPLLWWTIRNVGFAFHLPDLRKALSFGVPLVPHLLAHWVLSLSDRYLVERQLGTAAVGLYGAAYVFIQGVDMVSASVNRAWTPMFTRVYELPSERDALARTISWFVFAVSSTACGAAWFGPIVVRAVYAASYAEAARIVPWLAAAGLMQGLYYLFVAGLFFRKQTHLIPVTTVVAGLSNTGLNLLLLPSYGLLGAAWATVASYGVLLGGVSWFSNRLAPLPFERRAAGITAFAAATLALAILVEERRWTLPGVPDVALRAAICVTLLLAASVSGLVPLEDVRSLRARLKR